MVVRSSLHLPRFLWRQSSIKSQSTLQSTESTDQDYKKKSHNRRTRVRFEFDDNDQVTSDTYEYEGIDEGEVGKCFIPKHEMKQQKKNELERALEYARTNSHYLVCLELLFNSPLKRNPIDDATISEHDLLLTIGVCEARGMESRMSPLMFRHKQWAMKTILRRQDQLRNEGTSAAESAENLRVCCEHVNKCTRDLAMKYGAADEMEAFRVHRETHESPTIVR